MSVRNLEYLFRPRSVAVIGASEREGSFGTFVMRNLIDGGFSGQILPVNAKYKSVAGIPAHRSVTKLPATAELAVICTPPASVPRLVSELGRLGTKACILLAGGLVDIRDRDGATMQDALFKATAPWLVRVLGPNSAGVIVPGVRLNASFMHSNALPGRLAFVAQSGAIAASVLDWANSKGIGFSCFLHLGESADIDLGDALDYLASDADTAAILLHIESVTQARKFMSAARAAARNKPVVAVKARRTADSERLALTNVAAMVAPDDAYDAAMRRAGMVRVSTTEDLFLAAEALARLKPLGGEGLAIMGNGHGAAMMAADSLLLGGGRLAALTPQTIERLHAILPRGVRHGNPVDLRSDASAQRYAEAMEALLADEHSDAVLLIHAPSAAVAGDAVAAAVTPLALQSPKNVFACWLGGNLATAAKRCSSEAGLPTYETPEKAVAVFREALEYRRNRDLLMQTPPRVEDEVPSLTEQARAIVRKATAAGRMQLSEQEAARVLSAYGVPALEPLIVRSGSAARRASDELGYPVTLRLLLRDGQGGYEVGGIAHNLDDGNAVLGAAARLRKRLQPPRQGTGIRGFSLHKSATPTKTQALLIGAVADPVFGPLIVFGDDSRPAPAERDRAIGLPPLDMRLARDLVSRTKVARTFGGRADRPPVNQEAICHALTRVSQLICDVEEVAEIEIDPLLADDRGVLASGVRIRLAPGRGQGLRRFAIRPYPRELEERVTWRGRQLLLRPIRPEDEGAHAEFLGSLDPADSRLRFFSTMRELPHSQLARFTQIDYDREMAILAIETDTHGESATLGEVRAVTDPNNAVAEFALVVRSDLKGQGLGTLLTCKMIGYCFGRGTGELYGETMADNERMLRLARNLGFALSSQPGEGTIRLRLALSPMPPAER